jgi:hypothetical protein
MGSRIIRIAALYCNAALCTVTALHCTVTALHCHCTVLSLHCTALHCTALHCTALHCTALHSQAFRLGEVTVNRVGIRLLMLLVLPKKVVRLPRDWAEASHLVWFVRSRNGGLF